MLTVQTVLWRGKKKRVVGANYAQKKEKKDYKDGTEVQKQVLQTSLEEP